MPLNSPAIKQPMYWRKAIFALTVLCFIISLFSCTKQEYIASPNNTQNHKSLTSRLSPQQQRVVIQLLSKEELCNEWKAKFFYHYSQNPMGLTSEQRSYLVELSNFCTPEYFDLATLSPAQNEMLKEWEQKALLTFSKEQALYLFTDLSDTSFEQYLESINSSGTSGTEGLEMIQEEGSGGKCNCSTESDWCLGYIDCFKNNQCPDTKRSCGFLLDFSCNGDCR